jgi:hypothetical protein
MLPGRRSRGRRGGSSRCHLAFYAGGFAGGCDGGQHCAPLPTVDVEASGEDCQAASDTDSRRLAVQPVDAADVGDRLVELAFWYVRRPGSFPTLRGRAFTRWPSWSVHTCGLAARTGRWQPLTLQSDVAASLASCARTPCGRDDQGRRGSTAIAWQDRQKTPSVGCRSAEEAGPCLIPAPRSRRSRS